MRNDQNFLIKNGLEAIVTMSALPGTRETMRVIKSFMAQTNAIIEAGHHFRKLRDFLAFLTLLDQTFQQISAGDTASAGVYATSALAIANAHDEDEDDD